MFSIQWNENFQWTQIKRKLSRYPSQPYIKIGFLEWNYHLHRWGPSGCPIRLRSFPVKTSNLPDKCPMTGANLQPCTRVSVLLVTVFYFVTWNPKFVSQMSQGQHPQRGHHLDWQKELKLKDPLKKLQKSQWIKLDMILQSLHSSKVWDLSLFIGRKVKMV